MISVVIAAHNEAAVIDRCLTSLRADSLDGELEIIVAANGCTDDTMARARRHDGVIVIDVAEASKPAALNAGDAVATGYPRIYLDADIFVPARGAQRVAAELADAPGALAAVPARVLATKGRPLAVRGYFAVNQRLPVFRNGLFGRGMICLSEAGRGTFDRFPSMVADDLFLDSQFTAAQKIAVPSVRVEVETPLRTADLIKRLTRVRRGNAAMRRAGEVGAVQADVRGADRWAWLRDVVRPQPWLAPAGVVYVLITTIAAFRARRQSDAQAWERDDSTRTGLTGSVSG